MSTTTDLPPSIARLVRIFRERDPKAIGALRERLDLLQLAGCWVGSKLQADLCQAAKELAKLPAASWLCLVSAFDGVAFNEAGEGPVEIAARRGYLGKLDKLTNARLAELFKRVPFPDIRDRSYNTLAHRWVAADDKVWAERGAILDRSMLTHANGYQNTPLHDAAWRGKLVRIPHHLLTLSAWAAKNRTGRTPLDVACDNQHLDQLPAVAFSPGYLGIRCEDGSPFLLRLIRNREFARCPLSVLTWDLLRMADENGISSLHELAEQGLLGRLPTRLLGADWMTFTAQKGGPTPLHCAARGDSMFSGLPRFRLTAALLRQGQGTAHGTVFHAAAVAGNLRRIPGRFLTEANLLLPDKGDATPLHFTRVEEAEKLPRRLFTTRLLGARDDQGNSVLGHLLDDSEVKGSALWGKLTPAHLLLPDKHGSLVIHRLAQAHRSLAFVPRRLLTPAVLTARDNCGNLAVEFTCTDDCPLPPPHLLTESLLLAVRPGSDRKHLYYLVSLIRNVRLADLPRLRRHLSAKVLDATSQDWCGSTTARTLIRERLAGKR